MTVSVLFGHRVAPVTLFDASLLSTLKPPETAALFLPFFAAPSAQV
jgi:hypothetical protein